MAELLIYMGQSDPSNRNLPRVGDPVSAHPDGWSYGGRECLDTFLVIRLTDITLDQARQYVGPSDEGLYYFSRYYLPVHDLLSADEIRQIAAVDWSVPEFLSSVIVDRSA